MYYENLERHMLIYVWFMDNFIINYIIEIIDYKRFVMIVTADRK